VTSVAKNPMLVELVESVRRLPYGRPSERSVAGMLREGRGTCSTKHLYLIGELRRRFPETAPRIVHRVYRLAPDDARRLHGDAVAAAVPAEGVVDVHRYVTAIVAGRRVILDATFPGAHPWDGASSMPLACGPGDDHPAGADPDADKRALEAEFCDPAVREPLIAALGASRASIPPPLARRAPTGGSRAG
jgi:hypothetical protein